MVMSESLARRAGRLAAGVLAAALIGGALGCATSTEQPSADADDSSAEQDGGSAAADGSGAADDGSADDEPAADEPADDEGSDAGAASSELCAAADDIVADIDIAVMDEVPDPAGYPERAAAAAERFATIEAPAAVKGEWASIAQLFDLVSTTLEGKTIETQEDLDAALSFEGGEAFGLVITAAGFMEAIGLELQNECGLELGYHAPVFADACSAIDPVHLGSVFDGNVPEGTPMRWPDATTDCSWQAGDREIAITVGDTAFVHDDLLQDLVVAETVQQDGFEISVYDGVIGPFRFSRGATAYAQVGDSGVLASAKTGDAAAEKLKVIALVALVAQDVPSS